jgi:hypothetical protein
VVGAIESRPERMLLNPSNWSCHPVSTKMARRITAMLAICVKSRLRRASWGANWIFMGSLRRTDGEARWSWSITHSIPRQMETKLQAREGVIMSAASRFRALCNSVEDGLISQAIFESRGRRKVWVWPLSGRCNSSDVRYISFDE